MMDQSTNNLSGLSASAKNTYGEISRENQLDNFDYQQRIDQCDDPETKFRLVADLLELKSAGLVQFEIELFNIRLSQSRPLVKATETDHHSDKSTDEPDSKRAKIEVQCPSTSPKAAENDDDCPLTMLPPDLLAKLLINHIPIFEWPKLELLPPFQPAVMEAWRKVRSVNVLRDFLIRLENFFYPSSRSKVIAAIKSILQKLVLRSPFLTSLSGFDIPRAENDGETNSDIAHWLAEFEHLESLTMGDAELLKGVPLEALVEFLETTRSRTSLKVLNIYRVHERPHESWLIRERFNSSFLNRPELRLPLKLEKFSFQLQDWLYVPLDNIDASRLTVIRLGKESIGPYEWMRLLERAPKLRSIELKFLLCGNNTCNGSSRRLQGNKELLSALASHESLAVIELACSTVHSTINNAGCKCIYIEQELLQMLKTIGARGQLKKFAMDRSFNLSPHNIDMDRVLQTICAYIPSLKSIKLTPKSNEVVPLIVHLRDLEEIDYMVYSKVSPNILPLVSKLPHLKRLGLNISWNGINGEVMNALECLANATRLLDLRLKYIPLIDVRVFEKLSDSIAPNLQVLMLAGELGDEGLAMLLEKAANLRILILDGLVAGRILEAIAKSCPELEILGIWSDEYLGTYNSDGEYMTLHESEITVQRVQQIIDNCTKLRRLGGIGWDMDSLQTPKGLKFEYDVDESFWGQGWDSTRYD